MNQPLNIADNEAETPLSFAFTFPEGQDSGEGMKAFVEEESPCGKCGEFYRQRTFVLEHIRFTTTICPKCEEEKERLAKEQEREQKLEVAFAGICPKNYRETDWARVHPDLYQAATEWEYGPEAPAFIGQVGSGKTRSAFYVLKRMLAENRTCEAANTVTFAEHCANQFSNNNEQAYESTKKLKKYRKVDLLFLDDIGKNKMTERAELELYGLLEHRTSACLPTIWTSKHTGKELRLKMSQERGEDILRRLTEFSKIHTV
jgi:DNA replication protein DnaC